MVACDGFDLNNYRQRLFFGGENEKMEKSKIITDINDTFENEINLHRSIGNAITVEILQTISGDAEPQSEHHDFCSSE